MDERPPGSVRMRWFSDGSSAVEGTAERVADVLARAAEKWFASNNSPDAFVMSVVIERDGKQMTNEEADAYMRDELALKRASRDAIGGRNA